MHWKKFSRVSHSFYKNMIAKKQNCLIFIYDLNSEEKRTERGNLASQIYYYALEMGPDTDQRVDVMWPALHSTKPLKHTNNFPVSLLALVGHYNPLQPCFSTCQIYILIFFVISIFTLKQNLQKLLCQK